MAKGWRKPEGEKEKPLLKCFLCKGPHHARKYPKHKALSTMLVEKEVSMQPGESASMGALQLAVVTVKSEEVVNECKGCFFTPMEVKGQLIIALSTLGLHTIS